MGVDLLQVPALQSPNAARALLLGVHAAGARLIAVGERGIVVFSDDEGATWTQGQVPVSVTLASVFLVSDKLGWAAGHDGAVLKTTDGGKSWSKVMDGNRANALVIDDLKARIEAAKSEADAGLEGADVRLEALQMRLEDVEAGASFGPSRPLLGLWFEDERRGYVVGAFGQIFRTTDGGQNWNSLSGALPNPDSLHLNSIARIAEIGLVISGERGAVWVSKDDGKSWSLRETGYDGHLYGVLRTSAGALLAYGFAGNLFRSDDGGQSWRALPRTTDKSFVGGLNLANGDVVLVARNGRVIASKDGGATFGGLDIGAGRAVASVLPVPFGKDKLVAAGTGGVSVVTLANERK
ncbi:WD40/YVTN/BNR-like repeat-containing protein [Aromatoleum aromaticum]|uniref:WD40/YVTN/BNR-like repeat-containing protein n=1 Tax=Aromatoleum aromaticum TaxID=551760 RepID=UPI001459E369|nr:YCF48-related protein [Aromatoleum aromaticum]NMG55992.1 hypothetical protein [Aromatoleum aromaticum]